MPVKYFRILFLLTILFLQACSENENNGISFTSKHLEDAVISQDWNLASHIAQRILMEELDQEERYNALKIHVTANNHLNDYNAVVMVLESSLSEFKQEDEVLYIKSELTKAYANMKNYTKAMEYAKSIIQNQNIPEKDILKLQIQIIRYALENHNFGEAGMILDSLKEKNIDPIKNEFYFLLINYNFLSQQYEDAIKNIEVYLSFGNLKQIERARILFIKGDCYEILGKNDLALQAFEEALNHHPNPDVVKIRIEALSEKK